LFFPPQPCPGASWARRTGDGTISLAVAPNFYFAYCQGVVGGLPAVSPVLNLFSITSGQYSVYEGLLDMVKAQILTLSNSISGFPPATSVYGPTFVATQNVALMPCIFVTTEQVAETMLGYTTNMDDYGKGIVVAIVDRNDPEFTAAGGKSANLSKYLYWRQTIMRHFNGQRAPGVPKGYFCSIEPWTTFRFGREDPNGGYSLTISGMVLRWKTREPRTP
jgi:hypothetical protein